MTTAAAMTGATGMISVPGTTFWRGLLQGVEFADDQRAADASPPHLVALDGYAISRTPVTSDTFHGWLAGQEQSGPFVLMLMAGEGGVRILARGNDPQALLRDHLKDRWSVSEVDWGRGAFEVGPLAVFRLSSASHNQGCFGNGPYEQASWYEAWAYCEAHGGRLPTEAEWEWAALNAEGNGFGYGSKLCAGGEWCFDQFASYAPYNGRTTRNPRGPEDGHLRAVRGGTMCDTFMEQHAVRLRRGVAPAERTASFRYVIPGR